MLAYFQIVCGADTRVLDVVARWRGSAHDSRIFDACQLKERYERGELAGLLLGDSGYGCRSYLLTPLRNPRTPAKVRYNNVHISTRGKVEKCFGIWKSWFRTMGSKARTMLDTTKACIVAMCVLHNMAVEWNEGR